MTDCTVIWTCLYNKYTHSALDSKHPSFLQVCIPHANAFSNNLNCFELQSFGHTAFKQAHLAIICMYISRCDELCICVVDYICE